MSITAILQFRFDPKRHRHSMTRRELHLCRFQHQRAHRRSHRRTPRNHNTPALRNAWCDPCQADGYRNKAAAKAIKRQQSEKAQGCNIIRCPHNQDMWHIAPPPARRGSPTSDADAPDTSAPPHPFGRSTSPATRDAA